MVDGLYNKMLVPLLLFVSCYSVNRRNTTENIKSFEAYAKSFRSISKYIFSSCSKSKPSVGLSIILEDQLLLD